MKRLIAILIAPLLLVSACKAQKTSIQGSVTGLGPGASLVLGEAVNGRVIPRDTLVVDAKGRYSATVECAAPALYLLSPMGNPGAVVHLMLLPKEKVTMGLEYDVQRNFMKVTSAKGSRNAEVYAQFNNMLASATDQASQMALARGVEQLVRDNKDCLICAFLVTFFEQDMDHFAGLYIEVRDALQKNYADNEYVRHLNDKVKGLLMPGMEAPEIAMPDADGNIRKLSDLRGKVVMVDFWASWCRPCRGENPNVVRLYAKYHDMGFDIYSVSMDKDRASWLKAIKDDGLVWPNHVSDLNGWTSSGGATYGIMSIPATVLIDREGKIIARNLRGADLERKLAEIFGK